MPAHTYHRPLILAVESALKDIFSGSHHADKVIERHLKQNRKWGSRDRRFFAETVYDITRWMRRLLYTLDLDLTSARPWPFFNLIGVYLLKRYPDQSRLEDLSWPASEDLKILARWSDKSMSRAVRESIPDWLDARGFEELGDAWEPLLQAMNRPAPAFLRANRLKINRDQLILELEKEGILASAVSGVGDALVLSEKKNVFQTQAFRRGFFEMQDGGSQQLAPLLRVEPGMRVVDACAGAGGKSLHLAALMQNRGKLIALDVQAKKLSELQKRAARAGCSNLEVRLIESAKTIKRLFSSADRLLLDVPCSGSGVWRRNPDGRWKLTEEELRRLNILQKEILFTYAQILKPSGLLLYCTCSVWPSENEKVVSSFLQSPQGKGFVLEQEVHIEPESSPFDGFYGALLLRPAH